MSVIAGSANNIKNRGFSLLEIVVTLSLLAVALVAILSVANKIIQTEYVAENDFISKGLLIEGVALAEALRNANVNGVLPFYKNLSAGSPVDGQVYLMRIDYTGDTTIVTSLTDTLAQLKYDDTNFYQYGSGTVTKFYRMLTTTYHKSAVRDYLDVDCQVSWADHGKSSVQKISTTLYNTAY